MAERCGVETLDVLLRGRRLQSFGQVKRKVQEKPLARILELEVTGRRPRDVRKISGGRLWRHILDWVELLRLVY